jgi:carboxylesterase type B
MATAKVPFIVGDQEDEGTLFALTQSNVTTTALLVTYLKNIFFYDATVTQIEKLVSLYPDNAAAGSPFGTGSLNEIYPQFKRLAAILGDLTFTITRRVFLTIAASVNPSVPSWSYLASYGYGTPILGTFHATDILPTYGIVPSFQSTTIQSYYISFINYLDPNKGANGQIHWPEWSESKQLINFRAANNTLISDDFRNAVYEYLIGPDVRDAFHI